MGQATLPDTASGSSETLLQAEAVDQDLPKLESKSHSCSNCSNAASRRCSICLTTYYCSRVCQTLERKHFHKPLCQSYKNFRQPPSPSSKRGLLFPTDTRDPRWVWIPMTWHPDSEFEIGWEMPELGDLLGADRPTADHRPMTHNPRCRRALTKTISIAVRDRFLYDGSPFNMSIAKATGGNQGHEWRGPIVCLAKKGLSLDPVYHEDLEISDIRDVVDYFVDYKQQRVDPRPAAGPDEIPGVRISCTGDMSTFGYQKFTSVAVPPQEFVGGKLSGVSRRVGFPLLARQLPPDILWKSGSGPEFENYLASWLFVNDDPNSETTNPSEPMGWGWIPFQWQTDLGTVVVIREDCGPLSPADVAAMCSFCVSLQPLFENSLGGGVRTMTREQVLARITPAKYRQYRERSLADEKEYSEKFLGGGKEWAGALGS